MPSPKNFLWMLVALLSFAVPSFAQVDRAVLEGSVTDTSGGMISGAKVSILHVATGISEDRTTNSNGYYRFPGLQVGSYTVTVTNNSFKTKVIDGVELLVGQTHTLDVRLEVGTVADKVEIHAEATPADRSSAEASTVIKDDQILNLPNNGRDWASFTLLAPFAQDDGGGDQRTIRFAGRARDDNNFQFDGVDAGGIQEQAQKSQTRLQISQDAIAEYRVNSALYTAEYGTQAGGQVNVVTKSGTNDLHGTVFGYLRNSVFDARNFTDFDLNNNPAIPPFRMGQYGMTLGGPIVKDKTFFFINYEGLRQYQATTSTSIVPSASIQQTILQTSPQICAILQAYPWRASTGTIGTCAPRFVFPDTAFTPGQTSDSDIFTFAQPTIVHEDTWLVRIDHKFSDKTTLYGRAQRDISLVNGPNGVLDQVRVINHPANYFIALQHAFSGTLLNEAKVFVNRSPFINPQASILPYGVTTDNWTPLNNDSADHEVGTTYGLIDNLTWSHGAHTFKTGMEIRRIRLNQGQTANNTLDFSATTTPPEQQTNLVNGTFTGLSYDAPWCCHKYRRTFYLPYFQDEWKVKPNLTLNLGIRWEYYGVAHEADNRTTVFDLNQFHGACLGSGSFNTPFIVSTNTPACPRNPALYNANYKNFDPRVSVAWAPDRFQGKTVIRSGFGIYHGAAQNDDLNAGLESDTFRVSFKPATPQDAVLLPAYQQAMPDLTAIPSGSTAPQHPRGLQRQNRRDLYVETWGLTVDQELPASFLFSAAYIGSHGVHLFSRGAVNLCIGQLDPTAGTCARPLDQYFPGTGNTYDPNGTTDPANTSDPYGSVDYKSDVGTSTYHGLELSLERRLTHGLLFQTRYRWSHSINDGSVGGGESNGPQNVNCRQCDKGPSVFDIRHNFTANAIYELPFGPGKSHLNYEGVAGKIVGGWKVSGLALWHTGHPLTVTLNLPGNTTFSLPDGNDQTTQRPDIVPGVPLTLSGGGRNGIPLVNAAAFQLPPVTPADVNGNIFFTRFGNAPNGVFRALNSWQIDMALMKDTQLTERFSLEFGVQIFNILNHVQLGDPHDLTLNLVQGVDSMNNPIYSLQTPTDFGIITTTNNFNNNNDNQASPNTGTGLPRQIQFMMRLHF